MERSYRGRAFRAIDPRGDAYLLTPVYRTVTRSDSLPGKTFAAADCVGLLTSDGRAVTRTEKGRYRLFAFSAPGEVELFSEDPGAA